MSAVSMQTFTVTNTIPASLAIGNKSEENVVFTSIRKPPTKEGRSIL